MVYREGLVIAAVSLLLAVFIQNQAGYLLAMPAWLVTIFVLYVFRDPERDIPSLPLAVVSPADGTVQEVSEIYDPFVERQAIKIKIKMNALGIYTTRSPIEGKVVRSWINSGDNQQGPNHDSGKGYGLWVQSDEGDDVVLVLQPQRLLKSIKCFVQSGERIGQGRRCGFIRFGSTLEIYIPDNSKIDVQAGDSVHAGSSILATLVHKSAVSAI